MDYKKTLLLCAALISAIDGQLLCYYCDDCNSSEPAIEPCGRSDVSTPALTLAPGGDGGGGITNPSNGLQTTPGLTQGWINDGGVILTTQWTGMTSSQIVTGGSNGGGVVMTTMWPGMLEGSSSNNNGGIVLTTSWKRADLEANADEYACVTMKSIVKDHEVIRRGCVRQARSKSETCNGISEGNYEQCTLCTSPLCNNGN
ncbi:hypothetical protein RP20_CCG003307 [Aedes albopictus]|nr:hypothetical protein RP20_CCG003307 [Aedes albopictus]